MMFHHLTLTLAEGLTAITSVFSWISENAVLGTLIWAALAIAVAGGVLSLFLKR